MTQFCDTQAAGGDTTKSHWVHSCNHASRRAQPITESVRNKSQSDGRHRSGRRRDLGPVAVALQPFDVVRTSPKRVRRGRAPADRRQRRPRLRRRAARLDCGAARRRRRRRVGGGAAIQFGSLEALRTRSPPDVVNDAFIGAAARGASVVVMCPITRPRRAWRLRRRTPVPQRRRRAGDDRTDPGRGGARARPAAFVTDERALRGDPPRVYRGPALGRDYADGWTLNLVAGSLASTAATVATRPFYALRAGHARPAHAAESPGPFAALSRAWLYHCPRRRSSGRSSADPMPCPDTAAFVYAVALIHTTRAPHPKGQPRLRPATLAPPRSHLERALRGPGRRPVRDMNGAERELVHTSLDTTIFRPLCRPRIRQHAKAPIICCPPPRPPVETWAWVPKYSPEPNLCSTTRRGGWGPDRWPKYWVYFAAAILWNRASLFSS